MKYECSTNEGNRNIVMSNMYIKAVLQFDTILEVKRMLESQLFVEDVLASTSSCHMEDLDALGVL